jgi:hypothetical protein
MYAASRQEKWIAMSLEKSEATITQTGRGRWELELVNGKSVSASAMLLDGWLSIDVPVSDRIDHADLWKLLTLNASLVGLSKFVLMPDHRSVRLRCDISLSEDDDEFETDFVSGATTRVQEACMDMKSALARFHEQKPVGSVKPRPAFDDREAAKPENLRRVCEDIGWKFTERAAGKYVVDLEAQGEFFQATVEQRRVGSRVSADVTRSNALSESSRHALAVLLLRAGAIVRMARPAIEEDESQIGARFEVVFGEQPRAFELAHALSALSVACSLCAREAKAMRDEIIAKEYLTIGSHVSQQAEPTMLMVAAD